MQKKKNYLLCVWQCAEKMPPRSGKGKSNKAKAEKKKKEEKGVVFCEHHQISVCIYIYWCR